MSIVFAVERSADRMGAQAPSSLKKWRIVENAMHQRDD
jgi:hypothetical protein